MHKCCDNTTVPSFSVKLLNDKLYISYNNVTTTVDFANVVGGGTYKETEILVTTDGQTVFPNVIPVGEELLGMIVGGHNFSESHSYTVSGATITWISPMPLNTTDVVILKTQKS